MRLEDIESMLLSLGLNLRVPLEERVTNLKDCQAMRALRRLKEFIQNHPVFSLFLAVFMMLGFLPFVVFAVFVSSSFLVVAMSAVMVFTGTFAVAFASFLVVMFPVLMFGSGLAVLVYLAYCTVARILQIIKRLRSMVKSYTHSRKVRQQTVKIDASPCPVHYDHTFVPAANEELLEDEPLNDRFLHFHY